MLALKGNDQMSWLTKDKKSYVELSTLALTKFSILLVQSSASMAALVATARFITDRTVSIPRCNLSTSPPKNAQVQVGRATTPFGVGLGEGVQLVDAVF